MSDKWTDREVSHLGDHKQVNEADLDWMAERDQPITDAIRPAAPTEAPAQEPAAQIADILWRESSATTKNHYLWENCYDRAQKLLALPISYERESVAAPQAESAGKPDADDKELLDSIHAGMTTVVDDKMFSAGLAAIDSLRERFAKLRAELEQANQEKYRALNRLHETMQAAESSVTRLTREREELIPAVQSLLEWMPKYSIGSSGYLRVERVRAALVPASAEKAGRGAEQPTKEQAK